MRRARQQLCIVFYLVAHANRLDDVRARALRVATKLQLRKKDLCTCTLSPMGKRYMHALRARYRATGEGMRRDRQ